MRVAARRRDLRLQNRAHLGQVGGPVRLPDLDHQSSDCRMACEVPFVMKVPRPEISFHQSFFAKRLNGLPDGGSADAESLRQVALRGELVPWFKRALEDGFLDLLNDLLVEPRRANCFVHGFLPAHWGGQWSSYYTKAPILAELRHKGMVVRPNYQTFSKAGNSFRVLDPDRLDIREFANPVRPQFPAVS